MMETAITLIVAVTCILGIGVSVWSLARTRQMRDRL